VSQVYGSKLSAGLSTGAGGLPTQQKILLASLLLMLKRGRTKEVTLGKLMETYTKVCIADK
jgi:cell division control protein 6